MEQNHHFPTPPLAMDSSSDHQSLDAVEQNHHSPTPPLAMDHTSDNPALGQLPDTPHEPQVDTPMVDDSTSENNSSVTDYDSLSDQSGTPEVDVSPEDDSFTYDVEEYDGRHVITVVDVGEATAAEFAELHDYEEDYELEDEPHMFDDGLESDESDDASSQSGDSDTSTNYEDLVDRDFGMEVEVLDSEADEEEMSEPEDENDGSYDSSSTSGDESSSMEVDPVPVIATPKTLSELQKASFQVKNEEKLIETKQWKLVELQEVLRQVQLETLAAEADLRTAETALTGKQKMIAADLDASSLSPELLAGYEAFCSHLCPEYGLREGFSITCDKPHKGSYFDYDPKFLIFQEIVEMDINTCNFRVEAKVVKERREGRLVDVQVVEFWPIPLPKLETGVEINWLQAFPKLYTRAREEAQRGSVAAMEMLVRLPERHDRLASHLFEMEPEELLKDEPTVSKRWVFKLAQDILDPLHLKGRTLFANIWVHHTKGKETLWSV